MPDFVAARKASVKAARDRYYRTHPEQMRAKRRRWYEANAERAKAYAREYREARMKCSKRERGCG